MHYRLQYFIVLLYLFAPINCNPTIEYSFCPISSSNPHCNPEEFGSNSTLIFGDLQHNVHIHKGEGRPSLSVSCTSFEPVRLIFTAKSQVEIQPVKSTVVLDDDSNTIYYYEAFIPDMDAGVIRCESYENNSRAAEIYINARNEGPKYRQSGASLGFFLPNKSLQNESLPFVIPCIMDHYPGGLALNEILLKKMSHEKFTSQSMSEECINCMRKRLDNGNNDSCSDESCGPMGISLKMWQKAGMSSTEEQNVTEWKTCLRDLQCSLKTWHKTRKTNQRDCNGDKRVTCSDRYSFIRSYPNKCPADAGESEENFSQIEKCLLENARQKVEDAQFDPRFGFLVQPIVDFNAVYMCPSINNDTSNVFLASYSADKKIEAEMKLNGMNSNEPKGLSCLVPRSYQGDGIKLQMISCHNLLHCETQVETRGIQKIFRKSAGVMHSKRIRNKSPGAQPYRQNIKEPAKQGAAMCFGFFSFRQGFIWNFNYFFTGVDNEYYFVHDFSIPPAAVIALNHNQTNNASAHEPLSFNCSIATFIVFPFFRFTLHFQDRSTMDATNLHEGAYKLMPTVHDEGKSTQTFTIMAIPKTAVSLVCSAPFRNSRNWAEAGLNLESIDSSRRNDNEKEDSRVSMELIVTSTVLIVLLVISAAFGVVFYRRYRMAKELRQLTPEEVEYFLNGKVGTFVSNDSCVNLEGFGFPEAYHINSSDLKLKVQETLGEGEFGVWVSGEYKDERVAVKMTKSAVEVEQFKEFLSEIKVMAYIGNHRNIVHFIGALVDKVMERKCLAVCELSPFGDLLKYLRFNYTQDQLNNGYINVSPPIDAKIDWKCNSRRARLERAHLCYFCEQIAAAMEFLVTKRIVHADLAARNVLVFPDYVVKITDFGLSRKLYNASNYKKRKNSPLPWRWMAIESLKYMEFSPMTDMWSFGVTTWEVFSMGKVPYSGVHFSTDFEEQLDAGLRLTKPEYATDELNHFMNITWSQVPSARPTFSYARDFFQGQRQRYEQKTFFHL